MVRICVAMGRPSIAKRAPTHLKECPSDAMNTLSAVISACLFLPPCFQYDIPPALASQVCAKPCVSVFRMAIGPLSIMGRMPIHCHESCYLQVFAFAASCLLPPSIPPMCPLPAHAPVSDLRQIISLWVSRGRGLPLHYGVNSPPVWKEYQSTAKIMLSAFSYACLFLPPCFQ